jgi:hypothetical protein
VKLTHHVPATAYRSAKVSSEYQAQVDRSTARAEVVFAQAQRRLEGAERRRQRAEERLTSAPKRSRKVLERELRVADELVELRREELLRLQGLMRSIPSSVAHRGRGGYRPIPQPGEVL